MVRRSQAALGEKSTGQRSGVLARTHQTLPRAAEKCAEAAYCAGASALGSPNPSDPWLPVRWIRRNRFASIEKIGQYHGPLLLIHGTHDTVIPFTMGQTLFDHANEPKRFYAVTGADHNEVAVVGGRPYVQVMDAFLREVAGK